MQPEAVYVNFAMNVFYGACFGYFYSHFLNCERPAQAMLIFMCFYSLVLGPFSTFIQNRLLLKTIVMYGGCLCFLKVNYPGNSLLRIAAAFVINIIISGFVEFLSLSLHFLVSRERYDFANRYIVPGYVYVLQLLMYVFALTACIRLFAKRVLLQTAS